MDSIPPISINQCQVHGRTSLDLSSYEVQLQQSHPMVASRKARMRRTPAMRRDQSQQRVRRPCPVDDRNLQVYNVVHHLKHRHPDFKVYACDECLKRFETKEKKRKHAIAAHTKAYQKIWTCPVEECDMAYSTKHGYASLNTHIRVKHPDFKHFKCQKINCLAVFESEEARTSHILAEHNALRCRFPGCPEVFVDKNFASRHFRTVHEDLNLNRTCPVEGCEKELQMPSLLSHIKRKHPGTKMYICIYDQCKETFSTLENRRNHQKEAHSALAFRCSYPNCNELFESERARIFHERLMHLGLGIKCGHEGCGKVLTSTGGMRSHVRKCHERQYASCPYCDKAFVKENLNKHIRTVHKLGKESAFECPAYGCAYRSRYKQGVTQHTRKMHPGVDFNNVPCPLAKEELCSRKFPNEAVASMHANTAHRGKWSCAYVGIINCRKKFETRELAYSHATRSHDLYLCPVSNCIYAASQQWLRYSSMWVHLKHHQELGHLGNSDPPEPRKAIPGTPEWQAASAKSVDESPIGDDEDRDRPDSHISDDRNDEIAQDVEDISRDEEVLLGLDLFRKRLDVVKQLDVEGISVVEKGLKLQNERILKDFPPRRPRTTFGLKCIGPSLARAFLIDRPCPRETILTIESARVTTFLDREGVRRSRISSRCFPCSAEHALTLLVERHGILSSADNTTCCWTQCFEPIFRRSRFCEKHLYQWKPEEIQTDITKMEELQLRMKPVLERTWSAQPPMSNLLALFKAIRDGRVSTSRLRFLDLEFNARTKKVFEIGMCDAHGVATIDCRTPNAHTAEEVRLADANDRDALVDDAIRHSVQNHSCSNGTMSAHQVADRLREQGVGPRTLFVTWHNNASDLNALKQWLEVEGEDGVLPADDMCIPAIPHFRPNFEIAKSDDGRVFPLGLPIIFPLLMTCRHYLTGKNHHALSDAQQLYFMICVFEIMHRRRSNRPEDWLGKLQRTPDPVTNKFQTALTAQKEKPTVLPHTT